MQKVFKGILSFFLAVVMCLGITAVVNVASVEYAVADAVTDYYAEITASGGNALLGQVHDLITTTHTYYSTYANCRDYGTITDPALNGEEGVVEFYTHETIKSFTTGSGTGVWNREHVWCKSLSNGLWTTVSNTSRGGGADLHHIRPTESGLNSSRGNDKYGVVTNGTAKYSKTTSGTISKLAGYAKNDVFEPLDNVKGDVARIIMYVYTHYNKASNVYGTSTDNDYFGTLNFINVVSANSESAAIQLLLQWNKADPVDQIEITRNEAVYSIQGNRNPFIDHPEYADAIWGGGAVDGEEHVCGHACEICGKCTDKTCINAVCAEKCEGHSGNENTKLDEFHTAVAGIVTEGTLDKRLASINRAITAYRALTDADRASAEEDIAALLAAIDDYNQTINSYNEDAETANKAAGAVRG